VQGGLVAVHRHQQVRPSGVQEFGVAGLGVQRVDRDEHVGEVLDLVQQVAEQGNLVGLGVHVDLGDHHTTTVLHSREQVHWSVTTAARVASGAQRLAVHRQHQPRPAPSRDHRRGAGQHRPQPRPERLLQPGGVHAGQDPPERHRVGHRTGQAQLRALLGWQVHGPVRDRRERARPGHDRAHRHRQEDRERVPHSAAVPEDRGLREGLHQQHPITACDRDRKAARRGDCRGNLAHRGADARR